MSSAKIPQVIPFNPAWLLEIPLLDYYNPQYISLFKVV